MMYINYFVTVQATCKHFDVHTGPENIPESRMKFDARVSYRAVSYTHLTLPTIYSV